MNYGDIVMRVRNNFNIDHIRTIFSEIRPKGMFEFSKESSYKTTE